MHTSFPDSCKLTITGKIIDTTFLWWWLRWNKHYKIARCAWAVRDNSALQVPSASSSVSFHWWRMKQTGQDRPRSVVFFKNGLFRSFPAPTLRIYFWKLCCRHRALKLLIMPNKACEWAVLLHHLLLGGCFGVFVRSLQIMVQFGNNARIPGAGDVVTWGNTHLSACHCTAFLLPHTGASEVARQQPALVTPPLVSACSTYTVVMSVTTHLLHGGLGQNQLLQRVPKPFDKSGPLRPCQRVAERLLQERSLHGADGKTCLWWLLILADRVQSWRTTRILPFMTGHTALTEALYTVHMGSNMVATADKVCCAYTVCCTHTHASGLIVVYMTPSSSWWQHNRPNIAQICVVHWMKMNFQSNVE